MLSSSRARSSCVSTAYAWRCRCRVHATDSAQQVIDKAVQMFGGLGVTKGCIVERLYREIRALRIYEGASEVQKVVIARAHLKDFAA